jgi:DNA gyrase subunit B
LNVERARLDKVLNNNELGTMITALGTSIDRDFDITKLRYHKIVIMTDADVDGAHIRTLLLTFFYRFMPSVITDGYLYIAQPPLYKVKRGQSEVYLKDDLAMENHLIDTSLPNIIFTTSKGVDHSSEDLRDILMTSRLLKKSILSINEKVEDINVVEQAAIAGGFDDKLLDNAKDGKAVAEKIAKRLDTLFSKLQQGWIGEFTQEEGFEISRTLRGVKESYTIKPDQIRSPDGVRLNKHVQFLQDYFEGTGKAGDNIIKGPYDLYEHFMATGKKGTSLQRYKGLGEMNPEQLWETTLDPEARTFLQVKIKDAEKANDLFTTLMGEKVEPRRAFIQDNALKVSNLDA